MPIVDSYDQLSPHDRKNLVATLEELLGLAHEASAGFRAIAEQARDPGLRGLLASLATQREEFASELSGLLARYGHEPAPRSSPLARFHRRWTEVRAAIEGHDPVGLIAECERGEHHAQGKWEDALLMALPVEVESVLLDQVHEIRNARAGLDRMRRPY
jgi:uncharacterized protein (TIGR02284 family)